MLTVGSSPGRGIRFNLPTAIVPLRRTDNWITSHRPHGRGDEQILRILGRVIRPPKVTELILKRIAKRIAFVS